MIAVLVVLAILVLVAVVMVRGYNMLVRARTRVEQAWADVDVELTRRHDLVPGLVATVEGYAGHETGVQQAAAAARAAAVAVSGADSPPKAAAADARLTEALGTLFALSEQYPRLRADTGFRDLQRELASTEDRIAIARDGYNASVRDYDTGRERFPMNLMATMMGFGPREYFRARTPGADAPPPARF